VKLNDPFGRTSPPPEIAAGVKDVERARRVRLLLQAADALQRGELPSPEARLFLAAGLAAYLRGEGDLLRDCWRIKPRRGSKVTPAALATIIAMKDEIGENHETPSNQHEESINATRARR
jgi:hypothetical protein